MADRRVVITGVGPVSAVGVGRQAFFDGLRAGRTGIGPITAFPADRFTSKLAAEVRGFDVRDYLETEKTYLDRASQLAFAAMSLAMEDANLDPRGMDRSSCGLILGSAVGCLESAELFFADFLEKGPRFVKPIIFPHTYANTAVSLLAIEYGLDGYHLDFASGVTSSAAAILQGYDRVRTGRDPVVFAGGVEALSPLLLRGFELSGLLSPSDGGGAEGCAPFDAARNGFVLGEGAGMLVLEEAEHARQRGASVLAEIVGGGMASALPAAGDAERPESGMARAMRRACRSAGADAPRPGYISAAARGGRGFDRAEALAIRDVLGERSADVPVGSVKPLLGEVLGADGALRTIAAAGALQTRFVPPTLNLKQAEGDLALRFVGEEGIAGEIGTVLVNSIDPGGSVVCLAVGSWGGAGV